MFNFDQNPLRKNTNSVKFDLLHLDPHLQQASDILPMWVADMDFATDTHISNAINQVALSGVYGYSNRPASYSNAIIQWYKRHYQYDMDPRLLAFSPCVMTSIAYLLEVLVQPGDSVIIQSPVYPEFAHAISDRGAIVLENQLLYDAATASYRMNIDQLAQQMQVAKVMILCSPHNPVGRVWTEEELKTLLSLAIDHQVKIISDEIHCDLTLFNHQHHLLISLNPKAKELIYTLFSASKTFNLASLHASSVLFPNQQELTLFERWLKKWHINRNNIFSLAAVEAAYTHGEAWLIALKSYLEANIALIADRIAQKMPLLNFSPMQATYLAWIDCAALKLDDDQLKKVLYDEYHLIVNMGNHFGSGGSGFIRLNIATSKELIIQALNRLEQVYQHYLG